MNGALVGDIRAGSQHPYGVEEYIFTGAHKVMHVTQMSLYAAGLLAVPAGLQKFFTTR